MGMSERAIDITQLDLAGEVHSRVLANHYGVLLDAVQSAAQELGYFFAKADTAAAMPELLAEVLAEAIVLRKEASVSPLDSEGAEQRARRYLAEGFGEVMRDEILSALEGVGIRLQETGQASVLLTSAKIMRDEALLRDASAFDGEERGDQFVALHRVGEANLRPKTARASLSVDVTKDEIVISGDGSLATYNWRPDAWGNAVKRLSIRPAHKRTGDIEEKVFCVVAGEGEDSGRKGGIVAEDLSESEALALIKRIQEGVKVSLGITQPAIPVVELPEEADLYDAVQRPSTPRSIGRRVADGIFNALSIGGLIVIGIAVLCALSFGLPVAYKAGQHFSSKMFPVADAGDARVSDLYQGALLRAEPSVRPMPRLLPVPALSKQ
jgi:hypothetical protein